MRLIRTSASSPVSSRTTASGRETSFSSSRRHSTARTSSSSPRSTNRPDAPSSETDPISSEDFLEVLARRDAEAVRERLVAYAPDAKAAVARTMAEARPGDIVLFMAAGDLDAAVRDVLGA